MPKQKAKVIPQAESKIFMEGPELCRDYFKGPKLWLGTSTLHPGQEGAIDNGHPDSQEVFYVCKGHVLIYDEDMYYELSKGDAIWIPEGLPHTIINIGEEMATLVWAGAPGE